MAITTLCAVLAALRVLPNRSQFFLHESVSFSCEQRGNSSEWRVKKNTSKLINEECFISWERMHESHCFIESLYPSDSGVYWCESAAGECSDTVSITVSGGSVILESPVLPVMEGGDVTLSCRTKSASDLTADFYKDGRLIGSSSTGNMTIHSVSISDGGVFMCNVSGVGESPDSRLTVRAGRLESPDSPLAQILLPVVGACLSLVSVMMLLCLRGSHKGKMDTSVVLYTDVTGILECNQKREPLRRRSSLLSTVAVYRPVNTQSLKLYH